MTPTLPADLEPPFPEISALRAAHSALLKRHHEAEGGPTESALTDIARFLERGRATGALLDAEKDRWDAQGMLNYWTTVLYRAERPAPDATLAEYDPALAPELDDSLCPYRGLESFQ